MKILLTRQLLTSQWRLLVALVILMRNMLKISIFLWTLALESNKWSFCITHIISKWDSRRGLLKQKIHLLRLYFTMRTDCVKNKKSYKRRLCENNSEEILFSHDIPLSSQSNKVVLWNGKIRWSIEVRWFPYRYLPLLTNNTISWLFDVCKILYALPYGKRFVVWRHRLYPRYSVCCSSHYDCNRVERQGRRLLLSPPAPLGFYRGSPPRSDVAARQTPLSSSVVPYGYISGHRLTFGYAKTSIAPYP